MAIHIQTVNAVTLKNWLDRGEAVLVDVREPAEYAAEHIKGATLLPLSAVGRNTLPEHRGKKLAIHCMKGGRGGAACQKLLAEAPDTELYNLEGGITAWKAAGLPVESSGKKILPLDRQVQLTVCLAIM
jgi:rhodanese-related sulfurtransferase